jgi:2-polyprenyl-6-methoxyphenol hydroxylase-like FAD-dependent oxidoreductase
MTRPITIVGGGLAGLTLGILLRRANIPVTLFEAAHYPRHRVCGEFISGAGSEILRSLNIPTTEARAATLFLDRRDPLRLQLPEPALCISRYQLDAALAEKFQMAGGELRAGERFQIEARNEAVVRASGRRRAEHRHGHLFGLKAHAHEVKLASDLELHFKPNRYVGICRLADDRANICGLFYSDHALPNLQERWREIFSDCIASPALEHARWDEASFCAVAGLTLGPFHNDSEFCIGDAAAMIPPLTGNGMSMAFESAALAAPELELYSAGERTWDETIRVHNLNWRRAFSRRLRWANWTQRLVFSAAGQRFLYLIARLAPRLPHVLFSQTR